MSSNVAASGGGAPTPNSLNTLFSDPGVSRMAIAQYGDDVTNFNDEVMRETGFAREADAFDLRMQALTDPNGYNQVRKQALDSVGETVKKSYAQTYQLYRESGESHEKAKGAAKSAGMQAKSLGMKQFHVRFPDSDVQVYKAKTVKNADAFVR